MSRCRDGFGIGLYKSMKANGDDGESYTVKYLSDRRDGNRRASYIYLARARADANVYKVGMSICPENRVEQLRWNGGKFDLVCYARFGSAENVEWLIHRMYRKCPAKRVSGFSHSEWLMLDRKQALDVARMITGKAARCG